MQTEKLSVLDPEIRIWPKPERAQPLVCMFDGYVKEPAIEDIGLSLVFDAAFPAFRPDIISNQATSSQSSQSSRYQFVNIPGGRFRRFSGNDTLPRQRYSTVCRWNKNDMGGMVNEILAYSDPQETGIVQIHDMADPADVSVINKHYGSNFDPGEYLVLYVDEPMRLSPVRERLVDFIGFEHANSPQFFYVPYIIKHKYLDTVIDLRLRRVQDWFYRWFSDPQAMNLGVPIRTCTCFQDFLPYLLGQYRGGNLITQGIGRELRLWGIQGLVYPSARCDVGVDYNAGDLVDWYGWNLVDYSLSPSADDNVFAAISITTHNPGIFKTYWEFFGFPNDKIAIYSAGDGPHQGSWRVAGVNLYNQQRLVEEIASLPKKK